MARPDAFFHDFGRPVAVLTAIRGAHPLKAKRTIGENMETTRRPNGESARANITKRISTQN
jgi:hypothetical protein